MTKINHAIVGAGIAIWLKLDPFISIFASLLPDTDLVIAKITGTWNSYKEKTLLNAHRGITHHVLLIPLMLVGVSSTYMFLPKLLWYPTASFCVGYIFHLLCDLFTPLGLPYKLSYYPRISLPLFKTGSSLEHVLVGSFVISTGIYIVLFPEAILASATYYLYVLNLLAELVMDQISM